jgi:ELWxxDGT repeat protein
MKTHLPDKIKISALLILFFTLFSASLHAQVIQKLKDLRAGNSFPFDFTISGTKLFFIASDDVNVGLYVTDGTAAGTVKLTPSAGPANTSFEIAAYNNKVYFSYNDGINGYELWESDGTVAGTGLFKDLNTGSNNGYPRYFTVANNKLFFMADNIDGDRRMFVSDGTAAGTFVVKNNYTTLFNGLATFAILNNDIYFYSDNGNGFGNGLWKSDGTLAGTMLVKPDIITSMGGNYAVLNNKLFFNTDDGINGSELWTTDGTAAGTNLVINLRPDGGGIFYSGAPFNFITFNNKVYFTASDDTHGAELFSSDGTAAGTQIVKDMQPGTEGSIPQQSVLYNGNLYFSCYNGNDATGLWKSDGTTAGTVLIKQGGGSDPFFRDTKFAPVFNGKLYFIVNDLQFYPLWETDGTIAGTKLVTFQNTPSPAFSTPILGEFSFALYNSELYFAGRCGTISPDIEPCKITTGVLPVTWLGMQAQWQDIATAKISWQVADQVNVKDYTVQRSTDGIHFTDECVVPVSLITNYFCNIAAVNNSTHYYRIQQQDADGNRHYSKTVVLKPSQHISLHTYPNPVINKLYIQGLTGVANINITDASGKRMANVNLKNTTDYIDVSRLAAGTYFLRVLMTDKSETLIFIKNR